MSIGQHGNELDGIERIEKADQGGSLGYASGLPRGRWSDYRHELCFWIRIVGHGGATVQVSVIGETGSGSSPRLHSHGMARLDETHCNGRGHRYPSLTWTFGGNRYPHTDLDGNGTIGERRSLSQTQFSLSEMLVTNMSCMDRSAKTRTRLQEEALRLFTERGFDNVTVEEVARAAGVSHMTFFRHFPTKESVILDDPYDPVLGEAVASTDTRLPALERVINAVLSAWENLEEPGDEQTRARVELAATHPSLRAGVWENNRRTEEVIVGALMETGVDRLEAHVAAGAVNGSLTAALFDWAENDDAGSLGNRIRTAMTLLAGRDRELSR